MLTGRLLMIGTIIVTYDDLYTEIKKIQTWVNTIEIETSIKLCQYLWSIETISTKF